MVQDFPRTLSLLRQEKKISQRKAAAALGVSQALLSHYENGVREPGLSFVVRAADYYGVSADYLLGRTMDRDGGAILPDEVPDSSTEKGNVLRGSPSALLHKKLLVNSVSVLFDLLGRENGQITQSVAAYLGTAFYKVFRMVFSMDRDTNSETFAADESCYSELCDIDLKRSEASLRRLAAVKNADLRGDFTLKELQRSYPQLSPSLLSLLHSVSARLEKDFEKNEK